MGQGPNTEEAQPEAAEQIQRRLRGQIQRRLRGQIQRRLTVSLRLEARYRGGSA